MNYGYHGYLFFTVVTWGMPCNKTLLKSLIHLQKSKVNFWIRL
jgi:hypothetical protein